jgi:ribonuclease BN (tRNA processing enzyme)
MKELLVLGSGNAFNTDARGHTSFLLDRKILIDCGATVLLKIQEFKVDLNELEIILITHYHGDHFAGVPFILIYLKYILKRTKPLILMGPIGLIENYQKLLDVTYPQMDFGFTISFKELKPNELAFYKNYQIRTFPITHKQESIGYRIEDNNHSFAFTGDTLLNENVLDLMKHVDVGIMELSLWENPNKEISHVSLEELKMYRDFIKAKHLFFNHITNELSEEVKKITKKIPNFGSPLYDGMIINFDDL